MSGTAGSHDRTESAGPRRILLAGCGKLGIVLGRRLIGQDRAVFALRRDASALPPEFTAVMVDLRERPQQELPDVDAMVITLPPGGPADRDEDALSTALTNLAAALPSTPKRVIYVSSTRVFEGWTGNQVLTETDAPAPTTPRGKLLYNAESAAVDLFDAHILRPAGIYGPEREMLLRTVRQAVPVQYARRTNRIHETDLNSTLHTLLIAQKAPRLLHAVDQSPAPLGDVVTHIAQRLGLAAPPRIEPPKVSGTILDGGRLLRFLGALQYPDYRAGYDHLIASSGGHQGGTHKP